MIALRRVACPPSLAGENSAGAAERGAALAFFGVPANRKRKFAFDAYTAADIKLALRMMCGLKCAYCEGDIRCGSPADTEHFRPKAQIEIAKKARPPGYYWLASDWDNLLPSCIDCNRPRYQETVSGRRLTGKGNKFPLEDESQRATAPGEETFESALLINPCIDDPEAHLEFLAEGPVRPALDDRGVPSERGATTIEVLGLDRLDLCDVRADQGIVIHRTIVHYRRAHEALLNDPENVEAQTVLEEEVDELIRLTLPTTRFAALARQMIKRELNRLGLPLPDLTQN